MKANEMLELTFNGSEPEGSQSVINLNAEFSHNGKVLKTKGFYDGNGIYKVRFLTEEAGTYNYKISGIINESGTLEIEASDKNHHGIVRADGTHLRHADGTYIATFGTTVYALAHQSDELTEETFKSLSNGAFNKIRICLFPKHYVYNVNEPKFLAFKRDENANDFSFKDNLGADRSVKPFDADYPDFDFWKDFEKKLQRLFDMDIQVDLILFHPYDRWGHSHMTQENNIKYLDYLLRRFSAYPNMWWSMANEYDLFFDWNIDMWHEIDEFIGANDPYHHLLSNHNCIIPYDFSRPAITHVSIQSHNMNRVPELMKRFKMPVCFDECCYEGNLKETWGSISAKEMVNRFWKATVLGGYCTHGEVILDDDVITKEQQDSAVLWWAKGGKLKGESPARIKFLKEVIESLNGPLDPQVEHFDAMALMTQEEIRAQLANIPAEYQGFLKLFAEIEGIDMMYSKTTENNYAGHIGESTYLYYYGINCCARVSPACTPGKTYKAEAIDAWNMTRSVISENYHPGEELKLPGHEYMAVLLTEVK